MKIDIDLIRYYTRDSDVFNDFLRRGLGKHDTRLAEDVANLTCLLKSHQLKPPLQLYRGIGSSFAEVIRARNPRLNEILTDPGFMSTSRTIEKARNFSEGSKGMVFSIAVIEPIPGLDVAPFSEHPNEFEVLLAPGTKLQIIGFDTERNAINVLAIGKEG